MSNVEKVSVSLTPDMASMVKSVVASGEYGSASEAVREALREWSEKRHRKNAEIDALRSAWESGLNSGDGQHGSLDDILSEARRRHKI